MEVTPCSSAPVGPIPRHASRTLAASVSIALLSGLAATSGCIRDAQPCLASMNEGDLVITELRGPQEGIDSIGDWVELYNASGEALELLGLRGTLRPLKGSEVDGDLELTFLIREPLTLEAEGYVVLGTSPLSASLRPAVDYSINVDFRREPDVIEDTDSVIALPEQENADPRPLFGSGRLRLFACGREIDSFAYDRLPTLGTLSYDGSTPPDAEENDDIGRWCTDETEASANSASGRPGSAGEANLPCP